MYMRTSKDPKNAQIRKEGKERRESHAWRRERNLPHPANAFFGLDNLFSTIQYYSGLGITILDSIN